jgi:predicted Zn-dependent peptidase
LAIFYGVSEVLRKNPVPPADLLKKIDAVTAEQIQALAKELFKLETLNLAMIGPKKDEVEMRSLLQF